jgi:hypothetical protein
MMEKEPVKTGEGDLADDIAGSRDDLHESSEQSPRALTPEAQRALAEAEERRTAALNNAKAKTKELGGQDGPEPTRYGDWEKGGIVSDF